MVCERWWLTKVGKMEDEEAEDKERRDTESKTRTPHKDVGKKVYELIVTLRFPKMGVTPNHQFK